MFVFKQFHNENIAVDHLISSTRHCSEVVELKNLISDFSIFCFLVDIQTVRWLTELLQSLECIVVLVSHDR